MADYQDPTNAHFAREFNLEFASVVLVSADGTSPRRWKLLDKTWDLYDDPPAFARHVEAELAAFEGGRP